MRDWCLVLDTASSDAARRLGKTLAGWGADLDVEASQARVWCFADDEVRIRALEQRVLDMARAPSDAWLQLDPAIRMWNEERHLYVDPAAPDEDPDTRAVWIDSELEPSEIGWRVRLELDSVFEFRRVRRQLPGLRRPVIETGNNTIDLGARDLNDAAEVAASAGALVGVASAHPSEIRGRLRRWLVRQRLAGNYAVETDGSGPGYGFPDHFGWGDGGGGGNGGGGGHGGGGGGGHGGGH
jgi:hypothetical protein